MALRDDDGLADPDAASCPGVFGVRLDAVDPEVHAKAAFVDRLDPELIGERAERASREERRSTAAAAVGGAPLGLDQAHLGPGKCRHRVRPGADDEARRPWIPVKPGLDLLPALDRTCDVRPVGEPQPQRVGFAVVVRPDELERRAVLVAQEPPAVGDEVEPPVAARASLEQLDLVHMVERRRLDRRVGDPGDATAHALNLATDLRRVRAGSADHGGTGARREPESVVEVVAACEPVGERGCERVARPVGVDDRGGP